MADRDRNKSGQYADGIDPDTVLDVVDAREDLARPVTAGDVVDELGIARRTAHNKLGALVERGVLDTRKIGARGRVWWRPVPADETGRAAAAESRERAAESTDTSARESLPTTPERPDKSDVSPMIPAAAVDYPGGKSKIDCDEAIAAARQFLADRGGATKTEIVRNVMPEYPIGYDVDAAIDKIDTGERYRGAWWRRIVKPGLETFDDVEKPARGASEWRYTGDR